MPTTLLQAKPTEQKLGLTDLPKTGYGMLPPATPLPANLHKVILSVFYREYRIS